MENSQARIGIVENDPALVTALERFLRASGFVPEIYLSAEEFLTLARPENLSCLVLDVHLPGVSGFDLLGRLSSMACRLPVILMTADGSHATRRRARESCCAAFLTKPIEGPDLVGAIRRTVAG